MIEQNEEYFGKVINTWTNDHKNKYVITGHQQGSNEFERRIGRVVQVRLEAGDYGSDNVLLRHYDNELRQHANQSFWEIPDKFNEYLNEIFKEVYLDDSDNYEYTITNGLMPEKGFIIKSKIKDGESTPMRDIKEKLIKKISKL